MVFVLHEIATLLSRRIGLNPNTLGEHKISRAIDRRRAAHPFTDQSAYLQHLKASPQEFHQLVEQLVVPETWFFRDRRPFDFLVNFVRSDWLAEPRKAPLRILSAPCSSGEEPYSIAIALLEAGLSPDQISIDARDISHAAIGKARLAIYGDNSFRGGEWIDRSRYFQPVADRFEVRSIVRNLVNFEQCNLLAISPTTSINYDIIFCRNLLIYLEPFACDRLFKLWHRLLTPQGLLLVGAAETNKVPSNRFLFLRQSSAFAYRKLPKPHSIASGNAAPPIGSLIPSRHSPTNPIDRPISKPITPIFPQGQLITEHSGHHTAIAENPIAAPRPSANSAVSMGIDRSPDHDLQTAKDLADAGSLAKAIDYCKSYLEQHRASAEAHTLLGTLYQALNHDEQAEQCFQKALYLQPQHYEALVQLALLKESHGDGIGAKRLQERIAKLAQRR